MKRSGRTRLPHYTWDDYLHWEGRWELIDGIPHAMTPAPSIAHQQISHHIDRQLGEALDDCDQCQALLPVDWRISEDTVVQPDNLVIRHPPAGSYLTRAPVLIFEVLSKASAIKDRETKFGIYEREGVKFYVIVDPVERLARVYELASGRYRKRLDARDERLTFDLGPCAIGFDFSLIWQPVFRRAREKENGGPCRT